MAASAISAGKAFLQLLVDDAEFAKGLDKGIKQLDNFGKSAIRVGAAVGAAGAAIVAPFAASLKIFSDTGSALADMSARTGLSAKSLSELKFAAEQTGTSLEAIERAAKKMQKDGLDPNSFFEIAKQIRGIEDPVKRAQRAIEVWGKSGTLLLPMLDNLDQLRDKAHELGLVWDDEMVSKADRLGDAFDALKAQGSALASAIGSAVAPAISSFAESLQQPLAMVIEWIKNNGELVAAIGAIGVALAATGALLTTFGLTLTAIVAAMTALVTPIGLATAGATALGLAIVAVTAYFVDWEKEIAKVSKGLREAIGYMQMIKKFGDLFSDPNFALNATFGQAPKAGTPGTVGKTKPDTLQQRAAAQAMFGNLIGMLPGSLQARITGSKLPPELEKGFKDFGAMLGKLSNAQGAVNAAAEKRRKLIEDTAEEAARQINSFSRDIRGGVGGKFASQIGGTTLSESREEKSLQFEKRQLEVLQQVEAHLRKAQPLMVLNT